MPRTPAAGVPKTSKGGNRDLRRLVVRGGLSYVGVEDLHNFDVTARILLNGDLMFGPTNDFNALRVAKRPRSTTPARSASRQPLNIMEQTEP
jgi:hypothetical protein